MYNLPFWMIMLSVIFTIIDNNAMKIIVNKPNIYIYIYVSPYPDNKF